MSVGSDRWWERGSPRVDRLVVAIVAFPTFMDAAWNQPGTRQADWLTFVLAAASVGSLLWRRRWPIGVTVLCGAALSVWYLLDHQGELLNLPTMVGLYTVAVQGNRRRTLVVGVIASLWSGGLTEVTAGSVGSPMLDLLWPVVPLALGEAVRARHELELEHAAQAGWAEATRERETRHRIQAERVTMAREFHDVVAHTMVGVNVQMGVAVAAFDARPDAARRALVQAHASSKEALHELRATVALLRGEVPVYPSAPAPGIAQVEELADAARAAGIAVTVHDATTDDALPAAVELAAYRIVQEALTNVIRHARATSATVSLTIRAVCLDVVVTDDGKGPRRDDTSASAGHGIVGMTERAAALGGRLEHGVRSAGGYRVRAILPTRSSPP